MSVCVARCGVDAVRLQERSADEARKTERKFKLTR